MIDFIKQNSKYVNLLLLLIALIGVCYSYYLQYVGGLEPCIMCLLQRYALIVIVFLLLSSLVIVISKVKFIIFVLVAMMSGAGLYVAIKQTLLQLYPPEFSSCGRDLYGLYEVLPFGQFFETILSGSADCSKIDWTLFGLTLANYGVLLFGFVLVLSVLWLIANVRNNSKF